MGGQNMNANLLKAMELAVNAEAQARDRYKELAKQAEDQETRLLFEQIAREEDMHLKKLSERLKALKMMG
jgi:rubrerythrin